MRSPVARSATPDEFVLEAVPPEVERGEAGIEAAVERVAELHAALGLDAVNIPEIHEEKAKSRQGERRRPFLPRVEPRVLAAHIQERLDIPCIINRVVVHLERDRQLDWFRETWEHYGIRRFVLVGGESSDKRYPGPSVPEANTLLREHLAIPGGEVGNICIPSRRGEVERLQHKLRSGATFFTTQVLFHAEEITALLDALGERMEEGTRAPAFLVSLAPVRSERNIRFLRWLGVSLSHELEAWLTADEAAVTERSLSHLHETWRHIVDHAITRHSPCSLGVNIAPIGRIPSATTVALGRALRDVTP
ncbi:methylenetetrahydrofolate reductase [Halomonas daqiaonensis]|uniref:5,10-methylenetetrahydrofolate reductase n=1 Tax=Halomonas daqiaonensis TaxID=650850 RepID=A0A1H7FAL1_9GAMM|nr:methylenetetrahydrofolate reductase [Halomonas daqiaonensis]SEK20245.1 5,10-methylenetetrahydrofolate reductase [Halomonas daqiaonensis]